MRDYNNIISDVNYRGYKMYNESALNFEMLNKKECLKYLFNLIEKINKYVKDGQLVPIHNKGFYNNKTVLSFSYMYRIYTKEQIIEGIMAVLFNYKRFIKDYLCKEYNIDDYKI